MSNDQPAREGAASDGKTYFRVYLDQAPSPDWMRADRAGMLGLLAEDRDAVLRLEFDGGSVRFAAQDAEVGRLRRVLQQRLDAVNSILSGGRSAPTS